MVSMRKQSGFSLVELSIVLVILGLLVGGVLSGQSLIRAAELRSVSADFSRYQTAVMTFRDKYFALPGDMANATAFWGKDAAICNSQAGVVASPGTCNGDNNSVLGNAGASNPELFRTWQHLALSGLIEGNFTGVAGPMTARHAVIGQNVPRARISQAGFSFYHAIYDNTHTQRYVNASAKNLIEFGRASDISGGHETNVPAIRPEEAWNIDTKMDDGRPALGNVMTWKPGGSYTCSTNADPAIAAYNLTNSSIGCNLQFVLLP